MTADYDTLIVTFSDPAKVLDNMFSDASAWGTDSPKGWVEGHENTRMASINEYTVVITPKYNMPYVKEWLMWYMAIAEMREFRVRGGGNHRPRS